MWNDQSRQFRLQGSASLCFTSITIHRDFEHLQAEVTFTLPGGAQSLSPVKVINVVRIQSVRWRQITQPILNQAKEDIPCVRTR